MNEKNYLLIIAKRFREEVSKYEDFLRLPTPTLGKLESYFIYLKLFIYL